MSSPAGSFGGAGDWGGAGGGGAHSMGGAPPVKYICGHCGAENQIGQNDVIRCKECGHRILYKKRTSKVVQVIAR